MSQKSKDSPKPQVIGLNQSDESFTALNPSEQLTQSTSNSPTKLQVIVIFSDVYEINKVL